MKINKGKLSQVQQQRAEQLYKKLCSVPNKSDLKKIMKTTTQQNQKLLEQIKELRNRVKVIKQRQQEEEVEKMKASTDMKEQENVVKKMQSQLDKKYKKMKQLKNELTAKEGGKIENVENNKMKNMNEVSNIEKTMEKLRFQLKDLEKVKAKLEKTFEDMHKQENVNQPRVNELQQENKEMRQKIAFIRKRDHQKQYDSIKVQSNLIEARTKVRQNQARRTSMVNLSAMRTMNTDKRDILLLQKYEKLSWEVEQLKRETELAKQMQEHRYEEMKKIKNRLVDKNRQDLKRMKEAQSKRTKVQQENNLWRKKWQEICRIMDLLKNRKIKVDFGVQYKQYEDLKPLRRDYAGILNKYRFEDRVILEDNRKTKIIGMVIYQNQRGIIGLQAMYDNGMKSSMPLPNYAIERCKVTKIETSSGDFFKLFKVRYNQLDNKISKVEMRSNKNIKYQYGDKRPWAETIDGDTIYGFDIGIKEYPVCMFGSYMYQKGHWFLEGLGVEINELDL